MCLACPKCGQYHEVKEYAVFSLLRFVSLLDLLGLTRNGTIGSLKQFSIDVLSFVLTAKKILNKMQIRFLVSDALHQCSVWLISHINIQSSQITVT